jgi:hypothetical protein
MRYSDYEQRQLDIASGEELDRHAERKARAMRTSPFKVECDELAVKFSFGDGSIAIRMDLTPQAARNLAQDLIDHAQLCEDANEYELEQMS